uniref:ATP-dependent DNA helicase n=1 Tax=Biomphalaria glabrata TaxID=6526 RepID=A0A2C9KZE4_BIOGL
MRVDEEETAFAEFLLRIGDGELPLNDMGAIALPQDVISKTNIIDEVYGDCLADQNYEKMKDRAILAPLNKDVYMINCELIDRLPGEEKVYFSFDSIKDMSE